MSSTVPAVVDTADTSPIGDVAENWENDEAGESMEKQLSERFKQIRILQRAQADKEARKEKAVKTQEEARLNPSLIPTPSVTPAGPGGAPPAPVRILRRPESSDKMREEKYQAQRARAEEAAKNQLTPEQKEALYVKARDRIMGPEYKPDNSQNAQNVAIVSRCKSPEQIRVPRFTDLPLAGTMSGPSLDGTMGGPIMMSSMGTVQAVVPTSAVATPIAPTQQSSQQKPTSLLAMSSPPMGMPVQQVNPIAQQGRSQQVGVIGQQQTGVVTAPQTPQTINAYSQYVIAQPQQHLPYAMAMGTKQSMVPYIDTTRPPPAMTMPSMSAHVNPQQIPASLPVPLPPGVGQNYYNPQNVIPNPVHHQMRQNITQQQQQQSGVQYGLV
ncbi:hypothetical protein TELCIR_05065 [Teladorsagia circumcincta]|uniref:SUZ domain-containing protein n=1 Tax=Teladorsagia circumcincta TaxID=45464 RepID=A0A2G9URV1_TELCI|nr:hypothetical protein TELCIR_05065 [Teladorsagia circumcincta]